MTWNPAVILPDVFVMDRGLVVDLAEPGVLRLRISQPDTPGAEIYLAPEALRVLYATFEGVVFDALPGSKRYGPACPLCEQAVPMAPSPGSGT